ncbi:hypothetical protein KA047_01365 [Candidatus Saccharibacteria bacterium]|nr:hypothetical protein [Candidatus Saccharibacteria bacterium]
MEPQIPPQNPTPLPEPQQPVSQPINQMPVQQNPYPTEPTAYQQPTQPIQQSQPAQSAAPVAPAAPYAQPLPPEPVPQFNADSTQIPQSPLSPPAPLAIIDTQSLFQSDAPAGYETPSEPAAPKPKRRVLLAFSVLITVGLAVGVGYFIYNRNTPTESAAEYAFNADGFSDANSAVLETEQTEASVNADETSSDNPKATTDDGSSNGAASPSSSSTSSSSKKSSSSAAKKSTAKAKSTAIAKVSCSADSRFPMKDISPTAVKQVEASINAALAAKSKELTSWLGSKAEKSKSTDPASVDASLRKIRPQSCKTIPAIVRDKNAYSSKGVSFFVLFDKNASGTKYANAVNVSLVGNQWKTDRITIATPNKN